MHIQKGAKGVTTLVLTLVVLLALVFSLISVSVAWFRYAVDLHPEGDFYASSISAYFAGGNGTAEHPYLITEPIHIYNLAWLQYLGIFNAVDESGNVLMQYYFRVENDFDMNGLITPPVGTDENPFIGNFNGNGKCISGVTVSNYLSTSKGDGGIEQAPASEKTFDNTIVVGNVTETASIVGFFGVVGDWNDSLSGLADDASVDEIENKVNAVYNFFLDDLTVRTDTTESLVGLLAGYVSGSVANVGIGEATLEIGENVDALNITGLEMQQLVSEFSLIGAYNGTDVTWVDKPVGSGGSGGGSGGAGDGAAWGGSIDMLQLNKRITYMSAFQMNRESNNYYSHDATYRLYASLGYNNKLAYAPTTNTTNYLQLGTILPLNIDWATMLGNGEETYNDNVNGITGLKTTSGYKTLNGEIVRDTNTGYIVGSDTPTHEGSGGVRVGVQRFVRLARAYGGNTSTGLSADVLYSKYENQMVVLGYDGSSSFSQIADSYNLGNAITNSGTDTAPIYSSNNTNYGTTYTIVNGATAYKNYTTVRDSMHDMFVEGTVFDSNGTATKTQIHAMRFYEAHGTSLGSNKTIEAPSGATMAGAAVADLLVGSLNFKVKDEGLMTTVATTAFGSGALFRLYTVDRDESTNTISAIHQVSAIYRDNSTQQIVYDFADGSTERSGNGSYTPLFTYPEESTNLPSYALYYFEIPVRAGEYAIGRGSASSTAYLMYLDIGANGDVSDGQGPGGETPGGEYVHKMSGVYFVDDAVLADRTIPADYPGATVSLSLASATHAALEVAYSRTGTDTVTYQVGGNGASSVTVASVTDEGVSVTASTSLLTELAMAWMPSSTKKYRLLL